MEKAHAANVGAPTVEPARRSALHASPLKPTAEVQQRRVKADASEMAAEEPVEEGSGPPPKKPPNKPLPPGVQFPAPAVAGYACGALPLIIPGAPASKVQSPRVVGAIPAAVDVREAEPEGEPVPAGVAVPLRELPEETAGDGDGVPEGGAVLVLEPVSAALGEGVGEREGGKPGPTTKRMRKL